MERGVVRSICSCNFIIFLLCLIEVSSAPAQQHETSIFYTMKQDKNLSCKSQNILPWDHIKACENTTYPISSNIEISITMKDTLLCLGAYDAFYKVCNYSNRSLIDPTIDLKRVTSAINAFLVNDKNNSMEPPLCKNLKGLTPTYEKTKPLFSSFMSEFNQPGYCRVICFDFGSKPNFLCGILAWSKSLDQVAEQNLKHKSNAPSELKHNPTLSSINRAVKEPSSAVHLEETDHNVVQQQVPNQQDHSEQPQSKKKEELNTPEDNDKFLAHPEIPARVAEPPIPIKVDIVKSGTLTNPPNTANQDFEPAYTPNKEVEPNTILHEQNTGINETPSNAVPTKPDIAFTTISENTQEHDTGNIEDINHSLEAQKSSDNHIDDMSEPPTDRAIQSQERPGPLDQREPLPRIHNIRTDEDSHLFTYFTIISLLCIAGYVGYHNKQKILAIVLEGRRSRSSRSRRRPSTASYRKLDCTLEEAVTSQCNANVTHVIY